MIVSDTGPLQYLILLDYESHLPILFRSVLIPYEVSLELSHAKTPDKVKRWMRNHPGWAVVATPSPQPLATGDLHEGELAAIRLTERNAGSLLLIDDLLAKHEAQSRGLLTVGTVEVLFQIAADNMLNFEDILDRLLSTNFRLSGHMTLTYRQRWLLHQQER